MGAREQDAFAALKLDWVRTPEDVWRSAPDHVDGIHPVAARSVTDNLATATASTGRPNPMGLVIQGQAGTGKTHLLGWVRERVHAAGGYFFLVGPLGGTPFWESVLASVVDGLTREIDGHDTQLRVFLRRLATLISAPPEVTAVVTGQAPYEQSRLKDLVVALRSFDRVIGRDCQDTLRALVLFGSDDYDAEDVGRGYLLSMEEQFLHERSERGMRATPTPAQQIVREVSRLLSLTGPTVIAVDQIDTAIAESRVSYEDGEPGSREAGPIVHQVADGLLGLRDQTTRTLCLLTCLPSTWDLIDKQAVTSVRDRFRVASPLGVIGTAELAEQIVRRRFAERYQAIDFTPKYPTWPVSAEALHGASDYTPRALLQCIDRHIQACLATGTVTELSKLDAEHNEPPVGPGLVSPPVTDELAALDAAFEHLLEEAAADTLTATTEDAVFPGLLAAGLAAWIIELGEAGASFRYDPKPSAKPYLHARLRHVLDEDTGDETHWSFRAVLATNPRTALTRLQGAATAAGIGSGSGSSGMAIRRRLVLLREDEWSKGAKTQEAVEKLKASGGTTCLLATDDLRVLAALRQLLDEHHPAADVWLRSRRPASSTKLLSDTLGDVFSELASPEPDLGSPPPATDEVSPTGPATPAGQRPASLATGAGRDGLIRHGTAVPVGSAPSKAPVEIQLDALRKHTAIFAGSGSGKTVLIRRLIEECALRGVSSIVLDPNNDLARLGDAWPERPARWAPGDAELATEYLAGADVVIWTPRRDSGRPLSFQPLPDFAGLLGNTEELGLAIDVAASTLAARAGVAGATRRAVIGQAILRQALRHFARSNRSSLDAFIELLRELPDGVTDLDPDDRAGKEMAQTLRAATINDPLFGGGGTAVDPGELLTPAASRRARISVINLSGLPDDAQRQSFVSQLQIALFAWAKRNPATDRPLGGLFVMDEAQTFAPSGGSTPCTASTLMLASQVRKYGLGLVFATQAPKGLHNRIPGNAATQFFGRLNSPTQIDTAREMAKVMGGDAPDIGHLGVGEFYSVSEGLPFQRLTTPLCLSHHPASPLAPEEVVARARRS
ncbi:DUF87 domain-containing protein [Pseudofrankia sp. DC12]|uniref:helicase HerA domain-containing protein n=1 Tax=Pseudofrankia sp. DC12 TaxID=683315 RepID=UPI0005F7688A|nr:DUF87 domain-containing protein [Pseudofrankia sp. DC12]